MNLQTIIKNTIIQKSRPIWFDEFMNLALYHPKLGYYRTNKPKFGKYGDFITAPETCDFFGFSLARQCAQVLDGSNDILEFGAGSGVLAAQILFELGRLHNLPKTYYILELSAFLKQQQQQTLKKVLPELMDRIVWLDTLPIDFCGVVIANEVLDAMPCKRLIYQNKQFVELGVDYQNQQFVWQASTTKFTPSPLINPQQITPSPTQFSQLPDSVCEGYITEFNPQSMLWVDALFKSMKNGLVLLIDYGMTANEYFHPQRKNGTLRCHYQHQAGDNPFVNIGNQDISSYVNFSSIAYQAKASGFAISGFATQALFLLSLGIDEYLIAEKDENKRITYAQQVKQLLLPNAMGEHFKVLALAKNNRVKLRAFKEQNLAHKL